MLFYDSALEQREKATLFFIICEKPWTDGGKIQTQYATFYTMWKTTKNMNHKTALLFELSGLCQSNAMCRVCRLSNTAEITGHSETRQGGNRTETNNIFEQCEACRKLS